ncbi:carboxypeptidase-like regulatory domain-containing protein, partial [Flavitalea flava]
MRVTLLHIFLALSFISYSFAGKADGQEILDKKISLNLSSKEMKAVLKTISNSTEVGFTYKNSILPGNKTITVIANEERLGDVLDRIFTPFDISFEVIGKQIVLKKSKNVLFARLQRSPVSEEPFKSIGGTVSGVDGSPLSGVSVTVAGTSKGTVTDDKGHFQIQAEEGNTLLFSFIGYRSAKAVVGGTSTLTITLIKSENALSDVVVTALGIKRESRSIGYSAQKVTGADITQA